MQKLKPNSRSVHDVALGLLARREHSALELRHKLRLKGFAPRDIERELENLQRERLQSDERFTESYVHMRRQKGYGPLRITAELRERGISADLIVAYVDNDDRRWLELLQQQYVKKYGASIADSYQEKAKRVKYLQNRGFALDWILKAFTSLELEIHGHEFE